MKVITMQMGGQRMSKPKTKETDCAALEANMLQYRKEHFAVEVTPDRHQPGQIVLSVTSNGTQWTSIGLLKGEVARVIEALSAYKETSE